MPRLLALLARISLATVLLAQNPRASCAAETTETQGSATLYGGAGGVSIANNETGPDQYDVRRVGAGVYAVVRFDHELEHAARNDRDRGFFLAAGLTVESDWIRQTQCFFDCPLGFNRGEVPPGAFKRESELGVRLGAGYSFEIFEFRLGGLAAVPNRDAAFARPLLLPDVLLRVGRRPSGWFELGLGAYDPSTTLRPGVYLGGSLLSPQQVRITGHLGLHLVYSSWESTVLPFGGIADLAFEHAFGETWLAGFGGKVMSGDLVEGNLHLTRLF